MKLVVAAVVGAVVLAGCTTGKNYDAAGVEPIPGSITYGGQPRTKLTKSPVGSTFPHNFIDQYGQRVDETYMIQPDRTLKIVHREIKPIRLDGRD